MAVIVDSTIGLDMARALAETGSQVRVFGGDSRSIDAGKAQIVPALAEALEGAEIVLDATIWPLDRKRESIAQIDEIAAHTALVSLALTASTTEIARAGRTRPSGFAASDTCPPFPMRGSWRSLLDFAPEAGLRQLPSGCAPRSGKNLHSYPMVLGSSARVSFP
jgi:hypothetical protein